MADSDKQKTYLSRKIDDNTGVILQGNNNVVAVSPYGAMPVGTLYRDASGIHTGKLHSPPAALASSPTSSSTDEPKRITTQVTTNGDGTVVESSPYGAMPIGQLVATSDGKLVTKSYRKLVDEKAAAREESQLRWQQEQTAQWLKDHPDASIGGGGDGPGSTAGADDATPAGGKAERARVVQKAQDKAHEIVGSLADSPPDITWSTPYVPKPPSTATWNTPYVQPIAQPSGNSTAAQSSVIVPPAAAKPKETIVINDAMFTGAPVKTPLNSNPISPAKTILQSNPNLTADLVKAGLKPGMVVSYNADGTAISVGTTPATQAVLDAYQKVSKPFVEQERRNAVVSGLFSAGWSHDAAQTGDTPGEGSPIIQNTYKSADGTTKTVKVTDFRPVASKPGDYWYDPEGNLREYGGQKVQTGITTGTFGADGKAVIPMHAYNPLTETGPGGTGSWAMTGRTGASNEADQNKVLPVNITQGNKLVAKGVLEMVSALTTAQITQGNVDHLNQINKDLMGDQARIMTLDEVKNARALQGSPREAEAVRNGTASVSSSTLTPVESASSVAPKPAPPTPPSADPYSSGWAGASSNSTAAISTVSNALVGMGLDPNAPAVTVTGQNTGMTNAQAALSSPF